MNGLSIPQEAAMQQQLDMLKTQATEQKRTFAVQAALQIQGDNSDPERTGRDAAWVVRQAHIIEEYITTGARKS